MKRTRINGEAAVAVNEGLRYRNEWKYLVSKWEAEALKTRLAPFMERDSHAEGGRYGIRSLYFDDYWNSSYEEKLMGVGERQKWRIRVYNYSDKRISLERKMKRGSYIHKDAVRLSREECARLIAGDAGFLLCRSEPLCQEFYFEYAARVLRPKVMVDYEREPFVKEEGTVRITFDYDVRAAFGSWDLFDPSLPAFGVLEPEKLVLEVKFTEFLPGVIKKLLPLNGQEFSAVSKYTLCYEGARHLTDQLAGISKTNRIGM